MDGTSVPQPLLSQSQCERDDFARGQRILADNASSDDGRSTSDSDSECEHDSKNGPGTTIPHSHRPTTHDPNVSPYICASSVALCVGSWKQVRPDRIELTMNGPERFHFMRLQEESEFVTKTPVR